MKKVKIKIKTKQKRKKIFYIPPWITILIKSILMMNLLLFIFFKLNKETRKKAIKKKLAEMMDNKNKTINDGDINNKDINNANINNTDMNNNNITINSNNSVNNHDYFACYCALGKQENRYLKYMIDYYLSIGFEKFILGDNNDLNTEKFSDVIQDYIDKGIVDVYDVTNRPIGQAEFNNIVYDKYKERCKWISFFDIDEYLYPLYDKKNVSNVQNFLSNEIYDKCESVSFNWVVYDDNDLLYYENRSDLERFPRPVFSYSGNKYIKSIVRGSLNKTLFVKFKTNHIPGKDVIRCASNGEILKFYDPFCISPRYDFGYLIHFNTRTADEYAERIKRGHPLVKLTNNLNERLKIFFTINKFSEEKLKIFEKAFNKQFPLYHH